MSLAQPEHAPLTASPPLLFQYRMKVGELAKDLCVCVCVCVCEVTFVVIV